MFEELDRLAERGALPELIATATAALPTAEGEVRLELHHYLSWAWFELGDFRRALAEAQNADDPLDEAKALFHLWEFEAAAHALAECGDEAEAHWYRALVAEFTGSNPHGSREAAIRLAPDRYHPPTPLANEELERIIESILDDVPPELAWAVEETTVHTLPLPSPHPDVDPLCLGLYIGHDIATRSHADGARLPPRIEIYQRNIERIARDPEEAREELRITLFHEIAHHLGFDEDGVDGLGLA
ncbi:MAG: metallopeptidase family protein [Planctomycetota bacterium]|jgi:predicted Zn-dependent protease with MMP-like domain